MKTLYLNLIFLFLITISSTAQNTGIDTGQITYGEIVFEYEQIIGDSSRTFGAIYERIERDPENGIIAVTIVQELPNATFTDSIVTDGQTFLPIRYRSLVPSVQDIKVRYSIPGKTTLDIERYMQKQHIDTTLTVPTDTYLYDFHWPHLLLYVVQPPDSNEKKEIILPVFTYRNQNEMQTITYSGIESVELHGRIYSAEVWESTDSDTGTDQVYWIDTRTNRLLQNRAELKNGVTFWLRRKQESSDFSN